LNRAKLRAERRRRPSGQTSPCGAFAIGFPMSQRRFGRITRTLLAASSAA
jgi:hypothetical protein